MTQDADSGKPDTSGPSGLARSFRFAFIGIGNTIKTERNMKIHVAFAVLALVACAVLRCTPMEWVAVIVMIALVFAGELVNTAIESAVDLASPEIDPLAKRAKDCAAGAVLVFAIAAVVVGLIVYITAFMRLV